jgi:hypothetical protein
MTQREKLLKIREIAISDENYDPELASMIIDHISDNLDLIGNKLSMRTFVKVYELAKFSGRWPRLAKETVYVEEA